MENYKIAIREKARFNTPKGLLSIEQMWDLSLEDLNATALELDKQYKESGNKSFLEKRTTKDKAIKLKLDIVLDILQTKLDEINESKVAAENKRHNEKIEALIAAKESEELAGKSIEELRKMIK